MQRTPSIAVLPAARRPSGRSRAVPLARAVVVFAALVPAAACKPRPPVGEAADRGAARELSRAEPLPAWPDTAAGKPVKLYVDLSQSMRGFLDDEFRTDPVRYREVINVLDARLGPAPILGFGNGVRVVGQAARSTLDDRGIYTDGNTQMEDVFPHVAADSQLAATHLLIGDGRRADPVRANGQYGEMRQLAAKWIARGGTFAVAASRAPFRTVAADTSGCRVSAGDGDGTCPLYVFAFIAAGDEMRVASALAEGFEHLFVTPAPAIDDARVEIRAEGQSAQLRLEPRWVPRDAGGFVARARGIATGSTPAVLQPLTARIVLPDSTSPAGRARAAAIAGQGARAEVYVRALGQGATGAWQPSGSKGALVMPGDGPFHLRFVSAGAAAPRYLYRIDLVPTGDPPWLRGFAADSAGDPVRTYGLRRLFDPFRAGSSPAARPVLRAFVVVN